MDKSNLKSNKETILYNLIKTEGPFHPSTLESRASELNIKPGSFKAALQKMLLMGKVAFGKDEFGVIIKTTYE